VGTLLAAVCGLLLWATRAGEGLITSSYDQSMRFLSAPRFGEVAIVLMDDAAHKHFGQKWGVGWDRGLHAQLVEQLTRDQCPLIIFDVWNAEDGDPAKDDALARAIRRHGRVVIAGHFRVVREPGHDGREGQTRHEIVPPQEFFLQAVGTNWGIPAVTRDHDNVMRRHFPEEDLTPSLAWIAATLAGAPVTTNGSPRQSERWLRYYGGYDTLRGTSYHMAVNSPVNFFRDKVVFIGGKPATRFVGEEVDEFATPFTRRGDGYMAGVEIEATMFLNLWRGDWLRRLPGWVELLLLAVAAAGLGFGLCALPPMRAAGTALGSFVLLAVLGIGLVHWTNYWFPWLLIGAGQIPCAWGWSVLAHTKWLARENVLLEKKVARAEPATEPVLPKTSVPNGLPVIPDHALLRRIGKGAYGEVWLARNAVGIYHAVKIVFQKEFHSAEPYDREFGGIRRFMPVSHEHPGLMRVLHVGRNDEAAYFYYMMELGDGQAGGPGFDPVTYTAKTLDSERRRLGHFSVGDCVAIGLRLSDALEFLHSQRLAHRDIKPNNIIYVKGVPKFADIGLVTDIRETDESRTYIGTPGFIPPEGPGTAAADVYSLGKVLYVLCTGHDPAKFPELPANLGERANVPALFRLNEIILKACDQDEQHRYATAAALRADLEQLRDLLARGAA
jgi:CHASE2 domain-containing sensor protein